MYERYFFYSRAASRSTTLLIVSLLVLGFNLIQLETIYILRCVFTRASECAQEKYKLLYEISCESVNVPRSSKVKIS